MLGQFDLGFGSISGNSYNILDYLTVLSADQTLSGGFTLNWGPQTDNPDNYFLIYDGYKWSFDALLSAANGVTVLKDGEIADAFELAAPESFKVNEDETVEIEFDVEFLNGITNGAVEVNDVVAFGYANGEKASDKYGEESVLVKNEAGEVQNVVVTTKEDGVVNVKVTVSKAKFDKYTQEVYYTGAQGCLYVDLYLTIKGEYKGTEYKFADNAIVDSVLYAPAEA